MERVVLGGHDAGGFESLHVLKSSAERRETSDLGLDHTPELQHLGDLVPVRVPPFIPAGVRVAESLIWKPPFEPRLTSR
jgi:hypothetical protein